MRNQKGITLIALVITIIVLLILAGVSIAMLTGQNGILTQANSAKSDTSKAEAVERINLALNAVKAKIYENKVTSSTYAPYDSTKTGAARLESSLVTTLGIDKVETYSDNATNDTFTWTITTKNSVDCLQISYKSDKNKVTTVSGTMALSGSYTIDPAK